MDIIDKLHAKRRRMAQDAAERDEMVAEALAVGHAQHVIAAAAGMAVRTVYNIAELRGIERKRGRKPKKGAS